MPKPQLLKAAIYEPSKSTKTCPLQGPLILRNTSQRYSTGSKLCLRMLAKCRHQAQRTLCWIRRFDS